MEDNEKTSIRIAKETKEKLDSLGKKGDTYEKIISKLLEKIKNEN